MRRKITACGHASLMGMGLAGLLSLASMALLQFPSDSIVLRVMDTVGVPVTVLLGLYVYDRWILTKKMGNGPNAKEVTQHLDLVLTAHFDQLRRDLATTIERAHESTQKDTRNALTQHLLDLELSGYGRMRRKDAE